MPNYVLIPPLQQFFDINGNPLAGGRILTYLANSTTPTPTYTEAEAGSPENSNPIILDANGYPPNGVYAPGGLYKLVLQTSAGAVILTRDDILAGPGESTVPQYVRAFGRFSGRSTNGTCVLNSSVGIASVVRSSQGSYALTLSEGFSSGGDGPAVLISGGFDIASGSGYLLNNGSWTSATRYDMFFQNTGGFGRDPSSVSVLVMQ